MGERRRFFMAIPAVLAALVISTSRAADRFVSALPDPETGGWQIEFTAGGSPEITLDGVPVAYI